MEEIKVNEYIRTKDGVIAKVTDILDEYSLDTDNDVFSLEEDRTENFWLNNPSKMMEIPWEYIEMYVKKHSFNITDLIEAGDYVNGNKVVMQVNKEDKEPYLVVVVSSKMIKEPLFDYITNNRIKSIVTKEQFKAMEYEVK